MTPVLAHQGGWDEILLPAIAVLGLLWWSRVRRGREHDRAPAPTARAPAPGTCRYCGATVPYGRRRCPSCGFRVATG